MRKNFVGRLSITEFVKLSEDYDSFLYDTEEQLHNWSTIRQRITFYRMAYMLCPNRICFINDSGAMSFELVRYIKHYELDNASWSLFSIVCADTGNSKNNTEYYIIANKTVK